MASKSSRAFRNWRKRMNYTYHEAADALGLCPAAIGNYTTGKRRDKKEDKAQNVDVPKIALLACAAIENKLHPVE